MHEAEEAETNDWCATDLNRPAPSPSPSARPLLTHTSLTFRYLYPNGRKYYTSLRTHMKELVNQIIAEAVEEGFVSTRCRPGPKHVCGSTLLDPIVAAHTVEFADGQQRCRRKGCSMHTSTYCPGCAADEPCGPASGFYCCVKGRNCMAMHHRKRARTRAPGEADED